MIGSPDLLAFTADPEVTDTPPEPSVLPEEFSLPLFPALEEASPWSKTSRVSFDRDFILISEFSEQVGPQPLLTIPEQPCTSGAFDLNHFSLRIMSVDYQTVFAGPSGYGHPKLNFVEDSKVVLGDSQGGAYAYVHHLTLYDLEARGFVRPFCMAYVTAEEKKVMHGFCPLSAEFSKAAECLKTGNRKNFAKELDRKLADLEFTRLVLLREMKREGLKNRDEMNGGDVKHGGGHCGNENKVDGVEGGIKKLLDEQLCEVEERGHESNDASRNKEEREQSVTRHAIMWPDKSAELAYLEKAIQDHKSLLKQVSSFPNRKLKDPEFLPYDPDDSPRSPESDLELTWRDPEGGACSDSCAHTPRLVRSGACRQFDRRLKNLEELCDEYFLQQTLNQLRSTERRFRGSQSFLLSQQITQHLLHRQGSTNFLFGDVCESENVKQVARSSSPSALHRAVNPLQTEAVGVESYTSCVEMVPIKFEGSNDQSTVEPQIGVRSPCDNLPPERDLEDEEGVSVMMKGSVSSGESIEVLGTEKSFKTQSSIYNTEPLPQRPTVQRSIVESRPRRVTTRRENSEDSIEVLSTTESIIPDDLRASYPSAINEEPTENESEENENPSQKVGCTEPNTDDVVVGGLHEDKPQVSPIPLIVVEPPTSDGSPVRFVDPCSIRGLYTIAPPGAFQRFQDDWSDCTSYHSLGSSISEPKYHDRHGDENSAKSRRKCSRLGRAALKFLHQFPFAVQAIYSLMTGRTLVVLGSNEMLVRRCVAALSIFTPQQSADGGIQAWTSNPLQLTDLLTWKLIGFNRKSVPPPSLPPGLMHYSRYLSILDVDQKTLRCPAYRGSLLCPLVELGPQITHGTTYFLFAQIIISRLVSKAFLLTFSQGLQHHGGSSEEHWDKRVLGDLHPDDVRILYFLSELIKLNVTARPNTVLRFRYKVCSIFKL